MFDAWVVLVEAVERVGAAAGECVDAPVWSLPDDDLLDCLDTAYTSVQRLTGVAARLVREAEGRDLPGLRGAPGTATWVRERLRVSPHAARRLVDLGRELDRAPELDTAIGEGVINAEQVAVIAAAVSALPADVGARTAAKAQSVLVGHAARFDPTVLRQLGERILTHIAPDVAEAVQAKALARQQTRADATRTLALTNVGDGRVRLTGWLDVEAAAIVTAALDPLCSPTSGDLRTAGQRRVDALTDVCRLALHTGELPANGGDRPQIVVTIDYDTLRGRLASTRKHQLRQRRPALRPPPPPTPPRPDPPHQDQPHQDQPRRDRCAPSRRRWNDLPPTHIDTRPSARNVGFRAGASELAGLDASLTRRRRCPPPRPLVPRLAV